MPSQNRVNPAGELCRVAERGHFMGNRGVLHNTDGEIIRQWKVKAWITCLVEFKGRRRAVFTPNRYSELFFLDEATALAAGHRPCGECRYRDYKRFKQLWLAANTDLINDCNPKITEIDRILHNQRIDESGMKKTWQTNLSMLPDGVMIRLPGRQEVYLFDNRRLRQWSFGGYQAPVEQSGNTFVEVLTPPSIVRAITTGYQPQYHYSTE